MKGVNLGRVVMGGLLAGLVINIGESILSMGILGDEWQQVADSLGAQQGPAAIAYYVVGGFVVGLVGVWLYAAVRPRMGPGPATAVKVGLVVWLLAWAWPTLALLFWGAFPAKLIWVSLVWGFVEVPVGILVGAWSYREEVAA
ncbi:MAG: hypothetical protein LJF04_08650 [Gemmatimonadetes bacterium]|nr:hypothetical protein [Gemmatimonadota bacterium]